MEAKESIYNFFYEFEQYDAAILYNSRTGALSKLENKFIKQWKNFLETGVAQFDEDFLSDLFKCGYLVPKNVDELFLLKTKLMEERYNRRRLYLTIAPTMACNFRCVYCFEQGLYGKQCMGEETIENVLKFAETQLEGVDQLVVSWFGGEPLLALSVIERIASKLIEICKEKSIQYSSSIVTNGYLYDYSVATKLKELKVNRVQITLDGPEEIHDKRRYLINGGKTFGVILDNIVNTCKIIPISLRINVDEDSIDTVNQIMDILRKKGTLKYVTPYLGYVQSYGGVYAKDKCFSAEEYSKLNLNFWKVNNVPLQTLYPVPKGNYCLADHCKGWVIDDTGYVYKCWNEIGIKSRSIGNVNNKISFIENTKPLQQYLDYDVVGDSECKNCKVLPVCMGGCTYNRVSGLVRCEQRRYNLESYIKDYAALLLNYSSTSEKNEVCENSK